MPRRGEPFPKAEPKPVPPVGVKISTDMERRTYGIRARARWTDPITSVQRCGQINDTGGIVRIAAPAGASVVLVNLTAVGATARGSLVPAACSTFAANGATAPATHALVGAATSNMAAVPVGPDGTFCVKVTAPMHVIVDLMGTPAQPQRLGCHPLRMRVVV